MRGATSAPVVFAAGLWVGLGAAVAAYLYARSASANGAAPTIVNVELTPAKPAPVATKPVPRRLHGNLLLLSFFSFLFLVWLYYHTPLYPLALTVGGFFAWAIAVTQMLPEDRRKDLQKRAERLLRRPATSWILGGLGAIFLLAVAPIYGSFRIQTLEGAPREVELFWEREPLASDPDAKVFLKPQAERNVPIRTSWMGARNLRVKISGLPALPLEVQAWRRRPVSVPASFLERPVVLLRPVPRVGKAASDEDYQPFLKINGQRIYPVHLFMTADGRYVHDSPPYGGEALWIGCGDDVRPPPRLVDQWKHDLQQPRSDHGDAPSGYIEKWLYPRAIAPTVLLQPGDEIEFSFKKQDFFNRIDDGNDGDYVKIEFTVRNLSQNEFPQQEIIGDV